MRKSLLILFAILFSTTLFADDFVAKFVEKYAEEKRPLSNVNIGKKMLDKMAANTDDEEMRNSLKDLNSIRIVSTKDKRDARHYFKKANELVKDAFTDFEEVVSVNEPKSKIHVLMKKRDENEQDLIFIALEDESELTIITVSGKIDFKSLSKLSGSLKNEKMAPVEEKQIENKTN